MSRNQTITLSALAVLLVTGLVHALWTDRWGPPPRRNEAAARLAHLPLRVGDWDGQWAPVDPEKFPQEIYGVGVEGRFVHADSGNLVTVYLTVGRPGPLTVHTPEICYGGGGFAMVGAEGRQEAGQAVFSHAVFSKTDTPAPQHMRVLWSWRSGGAWKAYASPRLELARHGLIHKLYLVRTILSPGDPLADDPIVSFIDLLMPELERTILGTS